MATDAKVWFITGASRGLGLRWAAAALERGDRVAATARDIAPLADLVELCGERVLPIALDVTDRQAGIVAVDLACEWFGRLDVLVNNAGYGQFGFIEEISAQQARDQFDTNVFGALWLTQAALPIMRDQRSGHIIQVSSIAGITAFAGAGIYNASKWALEGFSEALAWEVAPLGIRVTLVEPAIDATGWRDATQHATPIDDYADLHQAASQAISDKLAARHDPATAATALLDVVDAPDPPLRVILGSDALRIAADDDQRRLTTTSRFAARTDTHEGESRKKT